MEAASRVAGLLTELFDSPVQLERVELMSWTNVEAHRVVVLDTAGRRMLTADRLIGGDLPERPHHPAGGAHHLRPTLRGGSSAHP